MKYEPKIFKHSPPGKKKNTFPIKLPPPKPMRIFWEIFLVFFLVKSVKLRNIELSIKNEIRNRTNGLIICRKIV